MRAFVLIVVVGACGGSSAHRTGTWEVAPAPKAERTVDHWTTGDEDDYMRRACRNVVAPTGELRCESLRTLGVAADRCIESLAELRATATTDAQRRAFRLMISGLSLASSCEEIDATFRLAAFSTRGDAKLSNCRKRPDGSYDLSSEDVLLRRGLGDRVFGETPSSIDQPIQVCGVFGEVKYLTRVTCADGTRPFGRDLDKAHRARLGSMTGASRCGEPHGRPVDLYEVPCPEKRYEVYLDMYECGPGESLMDGLRSPAG